MVLLQGPQGARFFMSEVPLFLHNPKPGIPGADRGVDASSSMVDRLRGGGATRTEDAQGTPSHLPRVIYHQVY